MAARGRERGEKSAPALDQKKTLTLFGLRRHCSKVVMVQQWFLLLIVVKINHQNGYVSNQKVKLLQQEVSDKIDSKKFGISFVVTIKNVGFNNPK
jgi:hypothetical protein